MLIAGPDSWVKCLKLCSSRACPCKLDHAVDVAKSYFQVEVPQDGVPLFVAEEHVSSFVYLWS